MKEKITVVVLVAVVMSAVMVINHRVELPSRQEAGLIRVYANSRSVSRDRIVSQIPVENRHEFFTRAAKMEASQPAKPKRGVHPWLAASPMPLIIALAFIFGFLSIVFGGGCTKKCKPPTSF